MINYLANQIQCEDNAVRIDLRTKVYYQNNNNGHLITFPYETSTPSNYDGVFPCIAVRRPTKYEVENCEQISLNSKFD